MATMTSGRHGIIRVGRRPGRDRGDVRAQRNSLRRTVFLVPGIALLGLLGVYPLIQLVWMAFHRVTSATINSGPWEWVGLDNFVQGFQLGETGPAITRTLVVVAIVTVFGMVGGFAAAVALRTSGWWSSALLALMVFVWALPPVVNGSVWKFLLSDNGLVNAIVMALGRSTPIPFLYDTNWALLSVAFVGAFAVIPFNALVFRAALLAVDPEIFEAAALDGVNRWGEVRHIMMPSVRPTSLVLLVLTMVYAFRSFDFIFVMTYGGPGTATNTLPFLGFLQAFARFNFGYGAATSVLAVIVVLVLAVIYARSIRKEEA
ncbi:carbohydrate ABC transporter permease [Xylanimonas ulmi]|uniref:Carbohydrate ABC transporter membrane protein 1 (CUT1 family) n=1 Tax=Xylanimonas ulmi TaxID=228973 RepID=A0A4Q7M7P2_9MICO|nr:sugar ABC transporter permease [Xylanibacterium ulmi]RZS62688.1 carbohydrate ABC transporter membrane protein 1 (CUT1 family) [Xylanibacterium ulmi]